MYSEVCLMKNDNLPPCWLHDLGLAEQFFSGINGFLLFAWIHSIRSSLNSIGNVVYHSSHRIQASSRLHIALRILVCHRNLMNNEYSLLVQCAENASLPIINGGQEKIGIDFILYSYTHYGQLCKQTHV